jgi:putative thiamine transport system permease protein
MSAQGRPAVLARGLAWVLLAALFVLPLAAALLHGLAEALDAAAWRRLFAEPALPRALGLSLGVALLASGLALALLLWSVPHLHGQAAWAALQRLLGPVLAVPHAAFAIGVALWLMPSGLPARWLAPVFGWNAPPDVASVQDPWGLGLALALAAKEWPFLLWCLLALLGRVEQGAQLQRQLQFGRSLGYRPATLWWRVLWPQLLPRLAWPLAAVWAYALTVVDMALVLGPARPPTLAVLAWAWLQEAEPERQRMGAAAALLLAFLVVAGMAAGALGWRALRRPWQRRAVRGDRPLAHAAARGPAWLVRGVCLGYGAVLLMVALASLVAQWPFPAVWPERLSWQAWAAALGSSAALFNTATLAVASAAAGVLLALAWLESSPAHWDASAAVLVFVPLWWPGMLLASGLTQALLPWRLDGQWLGVWLAHGLYTLPYAFVALAPAHRAFDGRYAQVARSLGRGGAAFLWRVKWPMLLAPLASAFAVAFAVSVAQYLGTQLVGAGRWPTVTTEALTLASGGQRDRVAAFALLQALLPALVFLAAAGLGRWQARRLGAAGEPAGVSA